LASASENGGEAQNILKRCSLRQPPTIFPGATCMNLRSHFNLTVRIHRPLFRELQKLAALAGMPMDRYCAERLEGIGAEIRFSKLPPPVVFDPPAERKRQAAPRRAMTASVASGNSKITPQTLKQIIHLRFEETLSTETISKRFNLSRTTVNRLLSEHSKATGVRVPRTVNRRWAHGDTD
jgi:hypothetical protein